MTSFSGKGRFMSSTA